MTRSIALAALFLFAPAPGMAAAPGDPPLRVGELSSVLVESPHPYPAGDAASPVVWTGVVEHPGATYLVLRFGAFDIAPGDSVVVRDAEGTEVQRFGAEGLAGHPTFWTRSIQGDRATLEIVSTGRHQGRGVVVDEIEHGFLPIAQDSVCGADDKQDVACYETSHPQHFAIARSVARLRYCGGLCTGSLVSCEDHFLTNQHCKGTCGITNAEAWFNYQNPACGSGTIVHEVFQGATDVDTDATLDYWVLTLSGNPSAVWDHLQLEPRPLVQDEVIYIPQHPGGSPKKFGIESDRNQGNLCRIDVTNANGNGNDTDAGYYCDTEGGSSGSPVLSDATHRVVALHHWGGCTNQGIRMENIGPRLLPILPGCSFCNPLAGATGLTAFAAAPNRIDVSWDPVPGASSYRVLRHQGGCADPFVVLGTTASTSWQDPGVSGGTEYGYSVEALDPTGCRGARAGCVPATATGPCLLAPDFAGVGSVRSALAPSCAIELEWPPATGACSTDVVYNVYRGTTPGVVPGPASRIASCLTATSFTDPDAQPGTRYYYRVLAEDRGGSGPGECAGGAADTNPVERAGRATSDVPLADFSDGAEGTPALALETPWAISTASARSGAASFRVPGDTSFTCSSLETPPLVVTSGSVLNYSSRAEGIEFEASSPGEAWDGGTVEISTDAGSTWTRLVPSAGYSHSFLPNSNSCNNDRLGGGCYSGTDAGWRDESIPLGAWAGEEVRVRFRFATDDSVASTAWWIDDVRVTATSDGACAAPACPASRSSITGVLAVKWPRPEGPDVRLEWPVLSEARDGYNVWRVDDKVLIPGAVAPGGGPVVPVCVPVAANACVAPGEVPGPGDTRWHYQVRGICEGTEGP